MGLTTNTDHATISADGSSTAVAQPAEFCDVGVFLRASGATFGSGTVKLQTSFDDGTTWLDVPSASFTSGTAGAKKADYTVVGPELRVNVSGSTSPTLKVTTNARVSRFASVLRTSFTADGTYTFTIPNLNKLIAFAAQGTWGSGTLKFEVSPDGGTTFYSLDSLTANGIKHIAATDNKEQVARLSLTGSSSPSLTAFIVL